MTHTSKPSDTTTTIDAPGVVSKEQASRLAFSDQGMIYEAVSQDGEKVRISITSQGLEVTVHDANGTLRTRAGGPFDNGTSALDKIAEKFQGQDPAPANIPRADTVRTASPYLGTAPADTDHTPRPIGTAPADADHTPHPFAVVNENVRICGTRIEPGEPTTRLKMTPHPFAVVNGLVRICGTWIEPGEPTTRLKMTPHPFAVGNENVRICGTWIEPGEPTTRLKMTLHAVTPVEGTASDDPLTSCTFGAVYSPNPTEEDGVFGKYTPFGALTYNVRSDIAQGLEVGKAYYIDITKVPS